MMMMVDDSPLSMANGIQFEPNISMVLAEVFKDYRFLYADREMTSSEVFSDYAFLPIMIKNASIEFERLDAGVDSDVKVDKHGLLGLSGNVIIRNKSEIFIWIAEIILTAKGFFGYEPQEVRLDEILNKMMAFNSKSSLPTTQI